VVTRSAERARTGAPANEARWLRWSRALQSLAPLLVAVPVFLAIAGALGSLLTTAHPDLGFSTTANSDAEALYLGTTIHQDPADGHTGQVSTPFFPFLVSLLHRVELWAGWPVLVNIAAALALVAVAARLAHDGSGSTRPERGLALVGAVAMGGFAWWLVSVLPVNVLYEGRNDHTAWFLALTGLVLLARAVDRSAWPLVGAALLLSAGFWTKQTTIVATAAAVVWILALAVVGAVRPRRAAAFCLGLAAGNLALLGLLNLLTDGWEFFYNFQLASEQPKVATFWPSLREFFRYAALALAFPALLAAGIALAARSHEPRSRAAPDRPLGRRLPEAATVLSRSPDARLASLLVLLLVIAIPATVYFRLKVGAESNQYVGVLWAVGLLAAVAYRRSRDRVGTALLASAALVVLFVAAQGPGYAIRSYWIAPLSRSTDYSEISPELIRYARSHLVWEQLHSDLNVEPQRSIYPNFYNFVDLLAAGEQPEYFVDALLDRRFDAVAPIRFAEGGVRAYWDLYASGAGRHEEGYIWKLNQVIRAGYAPAAGLPAGFLGRRPGPSLAPWMRRCFGPFRLAGAEFAIRTGGGLWCRDTATSLRLRGTPAASSEIHALEAVDAVGGRLTVVLPRAGGAFRISLRGENRRGWELRGAALPGGALRVEAWLDGRRVDGGVARRARAGAGVRTTLALRRSPSREVALSAERGEVMVGLPAIGSGDLSMRGSRGSDVRLDLGRLRLDG